MKNLLFIIFASLILSVTVTAQQMPDVSTVKTEKGMMVLNNNKVRPYSFLVPGGDPQGKQNSDGSLVIATESGVITVYFGNRSVFLDKKKTYTEAETLIAHRDQDISTQEKAWKAKLQDLEKGESFVKIFDLTNNLFPTKLVPTVYWLYTAPKPDNTDRTLYQNRPARRPGFNARRRIRKNNQTRRSPFVPQTDSRIDHTLTTSKTSGTSRPEDGKRAR